MCTVLWFFLIFTIIFIIVIYWKKRKWYLNKIIIALTGFGTIALVGVTLLLVYVVNEELLELRKQNKITEESFRQSYRPIGIIEDIADSIDVENDTLNYYSVRNLVNRGNGILINIGFYKISSENQIDFWSKSLIENMKAMSIKFDSTLFDSRYEQKRLASLVVGGKNPFSLIFEGLPFDYTYYLYSIFWYKDQENNLYETIHLDYLEHRKKVGGDIVLYLNKKNDFFRKYDIEEHNELYEMIKLSNHPIAKFIGKR